MVALSDKISYSENNDIYFGIKINSQNFDQNLNQCAQISHLSANRVLSIGLKMELFENSPACFSCAVKMQNTLEFSSRQTLTQC